MFNFLFHESGAAPDIGATFNAGSVCSYLINLDRAQARLEFVRNNIQNLGFPFVRVSAVDGNLLSAEHVAEVVNKERYRKYFKMFPERGTIGCALSHEKVWREFLRSEYEFALIFEDDVKFNSSELKGCVEQAVQKRKFWDILSFEMLHHGFPLKVSDLYEDKFLAVYLANITHSGCYLINRTAAEKFVRKLLPIFMGLDHYITASWEFDLKFLGVEPRIVHQQFGGSQIKTAPSRKFQDFRTKCSNAIYNIRRAIVHFLYNARVYLQLRR